MEIKNGWVENEDTRAHRRFGSHLHTHAHAKVNTSTPFIFFKRDPTRDNYEKFMRWNGRPALGIESLLICPACVCVWLVLLTRFSLAFFFFSNKKKIRAVYIKNVLT